MPEVARVVEIRGTREGSGFLIGPGLVLTARHVVRPAAGGPFPKQVEIRVLRDYQRAADRNRLKTRTAELLWPHNDLGEDDDFALLGLVNGRAGSGDDPLRGPICPTGMRLKSRQSASPISALSPTAPSIPRSGC
jgi:Trypsin-like peptidase domain